MKYSVCSGILFKVTEIDDTTEPRKYVYILQKKKKSLSQKNVNFLWATMSNVCSYVQIWA